MHKIITTNCIAYDGKRLLLGMKKRGFGEGRWNGFGGKVEVGEDVEACAKREIEEECGIRVIDMELVGVMDFEYQGKDKIMEVNVFRIHSFDGQPVESEEMKPAYFAVDQIPLSLMWPDDAYWMPLFLAGKKFRGVFLFEGYDTILRHELKEVEKL